MSNQAQKPQLASASQPFNSGADEFVTLQITLVCEVTSHKGRDQARDVLAQVARDLQLQMMMLTNKLPAGETLYRIGLHEPERHAIKPKPQTER